MLLMMTDTVCEVTTMVQLFPLNGILESALDFHMANEE
jgi:hypothetical protein